MSLAARRAHRGDWRAGAYTQGVRKFVSAVAALLAPNLALAEALTVGTRAPDFSLLGSDGETYALSRFLGKQGVVLAWFPKAFTPG